MDNAARSRRAGAFCITAASAVVALLSGSAVAETVATVNGVDIDGALFDFYLASRTQKPAEQVTVPEREAVLQELTDIYLLTTQPEAEKLAEDPRVKAQVELQYRGTLAQAVASNYFEKNPATDAEIVAEYEKQAEIAPPLQFKARHILVETQGAAIDLIKQLDDGEDFEELAKSHSTGPSGPAGGDLGWFASNQMVKPFSDAVADMADGAYTKEPVQTEFGWHVILREDSREAEPPTLESVRDKIKVKVEQDKFQNYLDTLRASASEPS